MKKVILSEINLQKVSIFDLYCSIDFEICFVSKSLVYNN